MNYTDGEGNTQKTKSDYFDVDGRSTYADIEINSGNTISVNVAQE